MKMTFGQCQEMTLTLNTHILLSTYLVVCMFRSQAAVELNPELSLPVDICKQ